jgi:hypothetical protein
MGKQVGRWKPKKGEKYWLVSDEGDIINLIWENGVFDKKCYAFSNCFQNRFAAMRAKKVVGDAFSMFQLHLLSEKILVK